MIRPARNKLPSLHLSHKPSNYTANPRKKEKPVGFITYRLNGRTFHEQGKSLEFLFIVATLVWGCTKWLLHERSLFADNSLSALRSGRNPVDKHGR